jgi:hypothetical protein
MRSSFSNLTRLAACWACLTLSPLALAQPPADTAPQAVRPARASLLIQSSPLAGSQYHALADVVNQIRIGDALTLRRVPDNPHDRNAIEVLWQGHILGFVPRRENSAVARAMDRGEPLEARISALRPDETPWRRLRFEISMPLDATATAQDSGSKPTR